MQLTFTPIEERLIAIIGTAGRSEGDAVMTRALWQAMTERLADLIRAGKIPSQHFVSGGAAWSDHAAVWAFNNGVCEALTLCLPAPFELEKRAFYQAASFEKSAANAANYYHRKFSAQINEDTLAQIAKAIERGATVHEQPHIVSYAPMFRRNAQIAQLATGGVVAFSFSDDAPSSKGTRSTWDQITAEPKININLGLLA